MISAQQIQATMARYVELVDAGDIDAIVALYAQDATVEDPVGQAPLHGIDAIARFYREGPGRDEGLGDPDRPGAGDLERLRGDAVPGRHGVGRATVLAACDRRDGVRRRGQDPLNESLLE